MNILKEIIIFLYDLLLILCIFFLPIFIFTDNLELNVKVTIFTMTWLFILKYRDYVMYEVFKDKEKDKE